MKQAMAVYNQCCKQDQDRIFRSRCQDHGF